MGNSLFCVVVPGFYHITGICIFIFGYLRSSSYSNLRLVSHPVTILGSYNDWLVIIGSYWLSVDSYFIIILFCDDKIVIIG